MSTFTQQDMAYLRSIGVADEAYPPPGSDAADEQAVEQAVEQARAAAEAARVNAAKVRAVDWVLLGGYVGGALAVAVAVSLAALWGWVL